MIGRYYDEVGRIIKHIQRMGTYLDGMGNTCILPFSEADQKAIFASVRKQHRKAIKRLKALTNYENAYIVRSNEDQRVLATFDDKVQANVYAESVLNYHHEGLRITEEFVDRSKWPHERIIPKEDRL